MKRMLLLLMVCALALLMTGCAEKKAPEAPAETTAPSPSPLPTPAFTAQGALADSVRALLSPYQVEIDRVNAQSDFAAMYTGIPAALLHTLAEDAEAAGAQPEEGRYRFTRSASADRTYSASAMQVEAIEAAADWTPSPWSTSDPVMDNQLMGDYTASGGGIYERASAYDVAETLSDGTIEITSMLNGAVSGHEQFSFALENGSLYFVDANLDQAVDLDGLIFTERYLVDAGVLRQDGLEVIEFTIPDKGRIPTASAETWQKLRTEAQPVFTLSAQGDQVQTTTK